MDPLHLVEAALKSARSVGRWGFRYGRQLRDAWGEAFEPLMTNALDQLAEEARQRLVEREEAEEVAEPARGNYPWCADCGGDETRQQPCASCPIQDCDVVLRQIRESFGVSPSYGSTVAPVGAPTPRMECDGPDATEPIPSEYCTRHDHTEPVCAACCYTDNGFCDCACHPENPPTAAAVPPAAAVGTSPGDFAAVAVREVLAVHMPVGDTLNGLGHCECDVTLAMDDYDWREHVSAEVARRINAAAADARVTDRLDAAGFAKNTFEQHRKT